MGSIFNYPQFQAFDSNGNPLNAGKLYSYIEKTTTLKDTYSDKATQNSNTNPVILDPRGEATVYLSGSYKFILKDSDDNIIWTIDEVDSTDPFTNTGLQILDTGGDHYLTIKPNENLTGNKTLSIIVSDGNRSLTLGADVVLDVDLTDGVLSEDNMASNSTKALSDQQSIKAYVDYQELGLVTRSKFTYKDANTIYIDPGVYDINGKVARWRAQLTSADIGNPTVSTWVYLYLDHSAITSGTAITNSELVWSEDPPAWLAAKLGWFRTSTNTDDRCIFAVYSDGSSNIAPFIHDGNLVEFQDGIVTMNDAAIPTSFADVSAFTIPKFSTRAKVLFYPSFADAPVLIYYRTNGQTGTTGKIIGVATADTTTSVVVTDVITDDDGIIEIMESGASTTTIDINTHGWYFPTGI